MNNILGAVVSVVLGGLVGYAFVETFGVVGIIPALPVGFFTGRGLGNMFGDK